MVNQDLSSCFSWWEEVAVRGYSVASWVVRAFGLCQWGKSISILGLRDEILCHQKELVQNILWWWQPRLKVRCASLSLDLRPGRHRGPGQGGLLHAICINSSWAEAFTLSTMVDKGLYFECWTDSVAETENTGPWGSGCVRADPWTRAGKGSPGGTA